MVVKKGTKVKKQLKKNSEEQKEVEEMKGKQVDKVKEQKQNVEKVSKKIKKEKVQKVEEQEVEQEILSYAELYKLNNQKIDKISQQLMKKVKLDNKQVQLCIDELLKYYNKTKSNKNILDINDDFIYMEVIVSEVPTKYTIRPQQIKLTHPIYSEEYQSQFCIFSTDPQREYKDKIQDLEIPCIAKVVGHQKLFKKYPTFMDKRKLANEYDLFFCDYRIYNLLNKLTGNSFYQKKKIPFAIHCQQVPEEVKDQFQNDYQAYLNDLSNYTYFSQGNGPVYTFKIARVNMTSQQIQQNIQDVLYKGIACILKEDPNVDSIHQISLKTNNSPSLPMVSLLNQKELKAYYKK